MEPSKRGQVHPGADDNASGTSGVLELARWFSKHPGRRRGILFMAFGGEEFGLLGSNHYVEAPRMPLAKAIAMVNLDMIGRVRNNRVFVGGVDTSANFKALVESLNQSEEAKFDLEDTDTGGYGSSDHYSFTPEGIPFLFFFSGLHPDYHTPGDTWDRVDAPQAARLLRLVGRVIERLLDSPERPAFQRRAS
jgi:Zn-dependent M28 family amino/carboxypeptidase